MKSFITSGPDVLVLPWCSDIVRFCGFCHNVVTNPDSMVSYCWYHANLMLTQNCPITDTVFSLDFFV